MLGTHTVYDNNNVAGGESVRREIHFQEDGTPWVHYRGKIFIVEQIGEENLVASCSVTNPIYNFVKEGIIVGKE